MTVRQWYGELVAVGGGGTRPRSWSGGAGHSLLVGWSSGCLSPFGDGMVGARCRSWSTLVDGGGSLCFVPVYGRWRAVIVRGCHLGGLSSPAFICGHWPLFVSGRGGRCCFGGRLLSLMGSRGRGGVVELISCRFWQLGFCVVGGVV
jgi:hypothetical protein